MPKTANDEDDPLFEQEAMRPSDLSSALIAIFIFIVLGLIMICNFSFLLNDVDLENITSILSNNTFFVFACIATTLCFLLYSIIYKFVLHGNRDAAAIGITAKFGMIAVGLAAFVANARLTPYVDLIEMFENTAGILFIRKWYPKQLNSIFTMVDNHTTTDNAHAVLASIFLSHINVKNLIKYKDKTSIEFGGDLNGTIDANVLKKMVILKNIVAQFCWLFFAVLAATFASIPELVSIA